MSSISPTYVSLLVLSHILAGIVLPLLAYVSRGVVGSLVSLLPGVRPRSIHRKWAATFWREGQTSTERVKLGQLFHWVWGTIWFDRIGGETSKYKFRGTLREDVLVAMYEVSKPKEHLDRGAFTLRLNDDANKMTGTYSWTKAGSVQSDRYEWEKRE